MAMPNTRDALTRQVPMLWIVIAMVTLVVAGNARTKYDEYLLPRPWLHPFIEIKSPPYGKPFIMYGARADVELKGTWTAWMEVEGVRCCTNGGKGHYLPAKEPRLWSWDDFFGRDWAVPTRPFIACVLYDVTTNNGARRSFGPFCSPEFDPRMKNE